MTDIEIKNIIESQLRKSGWIINEDGSCYGADTTEPEA